MEEQETTFTDKDVEYYKSTVFRARSPKNIPSSFPLAEEELGQTLCFSRLISDIKNLTALAIRAS
ncbi:MAG: hypothetical protein WBA64_03920 [Marinomonas sp.]|uniref:hypothetical protein n=1 Tax=unclassified Marinomonas TaxID=196814 RepID=UPI0037C781F7